MSRAIVTVVISSDLDVIDSMKSPPTCTSMLHVVRARNRRDPTDLDAIDSMKATPTRTIVLHVVPARDRRDLIRSRRAYLDTVAADMYDYSTCRACAEPS